MAKRPPFVPIDKRFASAFKTIRREYSDIEAAFSYALDVNCGTVRSDRSYARMWGWSNHRVKRWRLDPEKGGTVASQRRPTSVPPKPPEPQQPYDTASHERHIAVPLPSHKYKEQEQEKENYYTPSFESFWKMYPRKIGKKKAFEAWRKADCENGILQEVLKGAEAYADHCSSEKTEMKFIAHPTTWINQERWTDEYGMPEEKDTNPFNIPEEYLQ